MMENTIIEIPTELLEAARVTPQEARRELTARLQHLRRLNDRQSAQPSDEAADWVDAETGLFDLDNFLSWASHDLKTPLNSVIGFTKVVLKGIDGPINETQETDLTTAFSAGQRMLALVSYLVEIARLNNGHTKLAREAVNLADIIAETTNRWKTQNPARPLAVETTLADPVFSVDKPQMRQILSHLMTFASTRLTEGTVSLSASDSASGLKVRVQSHGKKAVDKAEMDSAMLGFITASLVKMHGGQMEDPQETEDGLLLRFTLPRSA